MQEFLGYIKHFNLKSLFLNPTENGIVQAFRYVFVGGISFLFDWMGLFFFVTFGFHYLISSIFGFIIGLIVNFFLSKRLVFSSNSQKVGRTGEFIVYCIIGIVGLFLTELFMYLLTDMVGIHYMISKVVTAIIVLGWNFIARKKILYSHKDGVA